MLRDECEWVELVDLGWNRLAPPTSVEGVVEAILAQAESAGGMPAHPYGDGQAAVAVAEALTGVAQLAG